MQLFNLLTVILISCLSNYQLLLFLVLALAYFIVFTITISMSISNANTNANSQQIKKTYQYLPGVQR